MRKIDVVAAIIENDGRILCVQRNGLGETGCKWEFPGGKIEPDETPEDALVREIKEELACDILVDCFFMTVAHQYRTFHLTMHCYRCTMDSDEIVLHEHIDMCWLPPGELHTLDWAPADLPVVDRLQG